jgi:hypothetical protein
MKEGVNPEPKLHGSFAGRGAGSRPWASDGFIVFASCDGMAALLNLKHVSEYFHEAPLNHYMRVARGIARHTSVGRTARLQELLRRPQLGVPLRRKHSETALRTST